MITEGFDAPPRSAGSSSNVVRPPAVLLRRSGVVTTPLIMRMLDDMFDPCTQVGRRRRSCRCGGNRCVLACACLERERGPAGGGGVPPQAQVWGACFSAR